MEVTDAEEATFQKMILDPSSTAVRLISFLDKFTLEAIRNSRLARGALVDYKGDDRMEIYQFWRFREREDANIESEYRAKRKFELDKEARARGFDGADDPSFIYEDILGLGPQ